MKYTISYREIRYPVNSSWHTVCLLYRPNSYLNAALYIYSSRLCFHPLNHNHDTKEALMCHSVPVFLRAHFNPLQFSIRYRDSTTRYDSQTQAHIHVTPKPWQMLRTTLPTPNCYACCDLPKQSTFPLLLLCLLHSNCSPNDTFHNHYLILSLFQIATTTHHHYNHKPYI